MSIHVILLMVNNINSTFLSAHFNCIFGNQERTNIPVSACNFSKGTLVKI